MRPHHAPYWECFLYAFVLLEIQLLLLLLQLLPPPPKTTPTLPPPRLPPQIPILPMQILILLLFHHYLLVHLGQFIYINDTKYGLSLIILNLILIFRSTFYCHCFKHICMFRLSLYFWFGFVFTRNLQCPNGTGISKPMKVTCSLLAHICDTRSQNVKCSPSWQWRHFHIRYIISLDVWTIRHDLNIGRACY